MISPAHDIAKFLASSGVGQFGGSSPWSVHVNAEPATPDRVITVYDTGGGEPDTDELDLLRPTFQVRARGDKLGGGDVQTPAYNKQEAVRDLLILTAPLVTESSRFTQVVMTSDILVIGRDDNDRFILTANYRAIRERA